ncbi:MAG: hypothetical protein QXG00_08335 [Candidatus Woesearchaeota archaeon]
MKIRMGFVSNSSSSSFIINLDDISAKQLQKIINNPTNNPQHEDYKSWNIEVTEKEIKGYTYIDNFDFYNYLIKEVMVEPSKIKYKTYH